MNLLQQHMIQKKPFLFGKSQEHLLFLLRHKSSESKDKHGESRYHTYGFWRELLSETNVAQSRNIVY